MIIKKVIDICKKFKTLMLYDGEQMQWISDGRAFYPLYGLPRFGMDMIAKTFDIPEEKIEKMTLLHDTGLPKEFDFEDYNENEEICERAWVDFCDGTITYTTPDGIAFLREVHLAPLADIPPDMMTVCERKNRAGKRYYVVKQGFMISAVITSCDMVDERMVEKTERIARLCKSEMLKKKKFPEREEI